MSAALTLHPLFSDQAIVARDVPLPIHGRTIPGQSVKISFAGQQVTARADASGAWCALLQPVPAGGPHTLTVSMASRQLIRRDILAGDIWLAVGQANMELPLAESSDARAALTHATLPRVRFFSVPPKLAKTPEYDCDGRWEKCTPPKAATFSALGFHVAKMLNESLDCPIGVIQATAVATTALSWISSESMRTVPELAAAVRAGAVPSSALNEHTPGAAFHGMIAPLALVSIRGVIAFQGESEVDRAHLYRAILSAQIQGWRAAWRRPDLPFLFVQVPGALGPKVDPGDDPWAELREAQAQAARLPATAMVVAADRGDPGSTSVRDQRSIAERMTLAALAIGYGRAMPYSGPVFHGHEVKGNAVHVRFQHAESGLRARQTGPLLSFAVAGADRAFRWADARIEDGTVIVSHPAIAAPVAVRYAWEARPTLTIENGAGLPAVPFRTDNWSGSAH